MQLERHPITLDRRSCIQLQLEQEVGLLLLPLIGPRCFLEIYLASAATTASASASDAAATTAA